MSILGPKFSSGQRHWV